jgi:hypothetical protein
MSSAMNLSPARGPSVWERLDRQSKLDRLAIVLISSGAAASATALARQRGRSWIFAFGAGAIAAGLLWQGRSLRIAPLFTRRSRLDEAIDRASADSFPASDPPSSTPATTMK